MKKINVASIIINYKDKFNCMNLSKKLLTFPENNIVIIVNNSMEKFQISKKYLNRIIVLTPKANLGFARGNNYALNFLKEKYDCNYVLIINSDILINYGTFLKLYRTAIENKKIGLLSCNMKNADGTYTVNHWNFLNYKYCCYECFYLFKKQGRSSKTLKRGINKVDVVRMSLGLCNFSVLKTVNFFDDKYFLYYEEDKLCKKINAFGYDVDILTNRFYIHNHPISKEMKKNVKELIKSKINYFNSMFIYAKDYLNLNKLQILILKIFTQYAKFEKIIYIFIRKYLFNYD